MTALDASVARLEGREKVTGRARYAYERLPTGCLYAWPVQARIPAGSITDVDVAAVLPRPGVVTVITAEEAPRLGDAGDGELQVLQSMEIAYYGQVVALVVAETLESAREAAALLPISYAVADHDSLLTVDHPALYTPEAVAGLPPDTAVGDVETALQTAATTVDATYTTPAEFNNPMETHCTVAHWSDGRLDVFESSQGAGLVKQSLARLFSIPAENIRVRSQHVGGGFGSKGTARPNVVLAAMAAMATGRPVKLAITRQMEFAITGYRTPTISRVRLGADEDGRLSAIVHDAISHTSTVQEYTEPTVEPTRHLYAAENRRTTTRVAALNVPTPRWMRGPGHCPGTYALECAMDELAVAAGVDPIELRLRNQPEVDPESGKRFSSRHLDECLRRGAVRFGWDGDDRAPGTRRDGRWLVGTGMASSIYPTYIEPASARASRRPDGRYVIEIDATDIGTGAHTALTQIAAEALGVDIADVDVLIGDSDLPPAPGASGSTGTSSWGWAVIKACQNIGTEVTTAEDVESLDDLDRHAYGAQFVEVRVDGDSGEIVVSRMLGVFAAGRIINARTARSQLIGGMTMGLSMALHEVGTLDPRSGAYVNHDFASYHIATNRDVPPIEVEWLDEHDPHLSPTGGKGVGEIGIIGTAAAVANAVWHATGIRVRDLPIQPDKMSAL